MVRRTPWSYIALLTATTGALIEACGSFGSNSGTPAPGDQDSSTEDGGPGVDGAAEAGPSNCKTLHTEHFDGGFGPFGNLKEVPPTSSIEVQSGMLVATAVSVAGSEAQVDAVFEDGVKTGPFIVEYFVTNVEKLPPNFTKATFGCVLGFSPDLEFYVQVEGDNLAWKSRNDGKSLDDIAIGKAPSVPTGVLYRVSLTHSNGQMQGVLSVNGGPPLAPVAGPVDASTSIPVRVKCGIDNAVANTGGGAIVRSIDWVRITQCL